MHWIVKAAVALGLILAAAPIGLVARAYWEGHRSVELPRPDGRFAVGRRLYQWAGTPTARGATAFIWYPAAASDRRASTAPYLPVAWTRAVGVMGPNLKLQDWTRVWDHSVEDAPPAARAGGFPVVVLTPGYTALPTDYTALAEDLASHGYVVAGLAPECCARVIVEADGRVVTPTQGRSLSDGDMATVTRLAEHEAGEIEAVLGRLAALNLAVGGPLAGRLDLSRVAMIGHSLGGTASLEACGTDPRCRAVVDLDGEPAGRARREGLNRPVLFLRREPRPAPWFYLALEGLSRRDHERVDARQDRDERFIVSRSPLGRRVVLKGGGHGDFADVAVLSPTVGRLVGLLGPINGRVGVRVTQAEVLAFLAETV
jgi:dienelactone hydrolase